MRLTSIFRFLVRASLRRLLRNQREALVSLRIQTCKYMGVDFLDFLRSGEKDIHAFAESRRGRQRPSQTTQPTGLPPNAIVNNSGQL